MFEPILFNAEKCKWSLDPLLLNLDPPFQIPGTAPDLANNSNYLWMESKLL